MASQSLSSRDTNTWWSQCQVADWIIAKLWHSVGLQSNCYGRSLGPLLPKRLWRSGFNLSTSFGFVQPGRPASLLMKGVYTTAISMQWWHIVGIGSELMIMEEMISAVRWYKHFPCIFHDAILNVLGVHFSISECLPMIIFSSFFSKEQRASGNL